MYDGNHDFFKHEYFSNRLLQYLLLKIIGHLNIVKSIFRELDIIFFVMIIASAARTDQD